MNFTWIFRDTLHWEPFDDAFHIVNSVMGSPIVMPIICIADSYSNKVSESVSLHLGFPQIIVQDVLPGIVSFV